MLSRCKCSHDWYEPGPNLSQLEPFYFRAVQEHTACFTENIWTPYILTGCGTNSHVRNTVACNGIIMESLFVLFYMQYCQSTGQYVCHIQTYDSVMHDTQNSINLKFLVLWELVQFVI